MAASDDEAIRAAVFPNMTIEEYRAMVQRSRTEFQRLPPERQARIRAKVGCCATCGHPDDDTPQSGLDNPPTWQCPACGRTFYASNG